MADTDCQALNAGTPVCDISFEGNFCKCTSQSHCTDPAKSRCSGGTCVKCSDDDHCDLIPGKPECDSTKGCVECTGDGHCSGAKSHCASNVCVACKTDDHCNGVLDYCSNTNTCVECKQDGHCASGHCVGNVCVECEDDGDCPANNPVCSGTNTCGPCSNPTTVCSDNFPGVKPVCSTTGQCVECDYQNDCDQTSSEKLCSASKACVECINYSDCLSDPSKPRCDGGICKACSDATFCTSLPGSFDQCATSGPNQGKCVECTDRNQCSGSTHECSATTNTCVECTDDTHCTTDPSAPFCGPGNACQACPNDTFCATKYPGDLLYCLNDGTCVKCKEQSHCPGAYCDASTHTCVQCLNDGNCQDPSNPTCTAGVCGPCSSGSTVCHDNFPALPVCSGGHCVECAQHSDCDQSSSTPVCETSSKTCVECIDHSHCLDDPTQPRCSGNTCQGCNSGFCSGTLDQCSTSGECVECTDDDHCDDVSVPFCGSGGLCQPCPGDQFCIDKYEGDLNHCISGTCVECNVSGDCTGGEYCSSEKTCVECTQDSECPSPSEAKCNLASYTCESCTGYAGLCASRFPDKPVCSTGSGECVECEGTNGCDPLSGKPQCESTSYTCVECTDHIHCQDYVKPFCGAGNTCQSCSSAGASSTFCEDKYPGTLPHCLSGTCVECVGDSDCIFDSAQPYCIANICKATIYQPHCSPDYNIQVKQMTDPNLNKFDVYFPSDLAMKVDIKGGLIVTLQNIPESDYTPEVTKLTSTHYQIVFAIETEIQATQLRLKLPCPSQPGYIFGDIILDSPTKRIPFVTPELQETIETIQGLASTATSVMAGASGSMMLAGANPAIMWALIGLLQAFYYMIFINVNYPANVQAFFGLFTLGNLSFIPNPIGWFFPDIDDETLNAPYKFTDNDVNGLFLQTGGNMLLTWFLVIVGYIASKLFIRFTRNMPKLLGMAASKTVEIFEWSGVLRTLITSYTQLSMASLLQLRVLSFETELYGVSSGSGIAFIAFTFLFPLMLFWIIHKYSKSPRILKVKYSTLIEEFKYEKTPLYFNAFFVLRRLAMILSLVFLHDYPYLEVFLLILNCVVWTVLLVKFLPYDNKINNVVNILSEILFVAIHVIIFLFAHDDHVDWLTDQEKLDLGWIIIGCCGVILVLTLIASFVQQFFVLKNLLKLFWQVMKGKKPNSGKKIKRKTSPQIYPQPPSAIGSGELNLESSGNSTREYFENSMASVAPTHKPDVYSNSPKRRIRRRVRAGSTNRVLPLDL